MNNPSTPSPEWEQKSMEERFREKFPSTFRRIDGKDYIEINSFATTPESLLDFIHQEILSATAAGEARVRVREEVKELYLPQDIDERNRLVKGWNLAVDKVLALLTPTK